MEKQQRTAEILHEAHTRAMDTAKIRSMRLKFIIRKLCREFPWAIVLAAAGMAAGIISIIIADTR